MYIYIYVYERIAFAVSSIVFTNATRAPPGPKVSKIMPSRIFNTSSLPKLVVALRVPFFVFGAFYTETVQHR